MKSEGAIMANCVYPWDLDPWDPANPGESQTCPQCGRFFVPANERAEYCSPACRTAAMKEQTKNKGDLEASVAYKDPYARLAVAVLRQATQDAKNGGVDAILWLAADEAEPYAGLSEIDSEEFVSLGIKLLQETPVNELHLTDPLAE